MKFIKKGSFPEEQIKSFASEINVSEAFSEILLSRGINSFEKAAEFLNPSTEIMSDPFAIDGMEAAVARIKEAISKKEKVLIYGDYDCDGICSISILMLYFKGILDGVEFFIPDRNNDGYGMSISALEKILAAKKPDLVITVDTGISAVEEIEFLKSNGVDVVVTDHHEPQKRLPNCILVDPKIKKEGFFDFAGAGVVLKLVEALAGRDKALEYLDIAAIATVADIVSLSGENRVIASLGIKKLNKQPRKGISLLLGETSKISTYDIMFKIAPRINAAGRMDNAMKAVDLFVSDDHFVLSCLAEELNKDNKDRQQRSEQIVSEAEEMLRKSCRVTDTAIILLASENWEAGILGIAAAKLTEKFNRPAILFSESDGELKGSARSIKAVDIFEALSQFSDMFLSYGGHKQAAGVRIEKSNFAAFKEKINAYIFAKYGEAAFMPEVRFDQELKKENLTLSFAKEIESLEPTGYGNPKPKFIMKTDGLAFEQIGQTPHIKYKKGDFEIIAFNSIKLMTALSGRNVLEMTLSRNIFRNTDYVQGTLRNVFPDPAKGFAYDISENLASQLTIIASDPERQEKNVKIDFKTAIKTVKNHEKLPLFDAKFGILYVVFSNSGLEKYRNLLADVIDGVSISAGFSSHPANRLILAPTCDFPWVEYEQIVFLEQPLTQGFLDAVAESADAEIYVITDKEYIKDLGHIDLDLLRKIYSNLRLFDGQRIKSQKELCKEIVRGINDCTPFCFYAALNVFKELKLIEFQNNSILRVLNTKSDIKSAVSYKNLKTLFDFVD